MFSHTTHTIIHATVLTLENNKKKSGIVLKKNNGISHFVKPTCTTKIIHYIESYFKQKSSHSILPEILKENRNEKKSDTSQNAQ